MKLIFKISDWINKIIQNVVCVFLLVILLDMFYAVIMRYIFNKTPVWADELARYAFVWLQMLAATIATKKCTHTRITLISDRLKGSWRKWHTAILLFIVLVISYLILTQSLLLLKFEGDTPTSTLPFTMIWVYAAIPSGAAIMIFHAAANALQLFVAHE